MVPYLALRLQGLGIIVSVATYVMISGIRGPAWTAVIKDAMVLVAASFATGGFAVRREQSA